MKKAKIIAVVTFPIVGSILAFALMILGLKKNNGYLYPHLDLLDKVPALLVVMMLFVVVYSPLSTLFFGPRKLALKIVASLLILFFFVVYLVLSLVALTPVWMSKTDDTTHFAHLDEKAETIIENRFGGVFDFDEPSVAEYFYSYKSGISEVLVIEYKVTLTEEEYGAWVELMESKNSFTVEETAKGYLMNLSFEELRSAITGHCSIECDSNERTVKLDLEYKYEQ